MQSFASATNRSVKVSHSAFETSTFVCGAALYYLLRRSGVSVHEAIRRGKIPPMPTQERFRLGYRRYTFRLKSSHLSTSLFSCFAADRSRGQDHDFGTGHCSHLRVEA